MNWSWLIEPPLLQLMMAGVLTYVLYTLFSIGDFYKVNRKSSTILGTIIMLFLYAVSQSLLWTFTVFLINPYSLSAKFNMLLIAWHIMMMIIAGGFLWKSTFKYRYRISTFLFSTTIAGFSIYFLYQFTTMSLQQFLLTSMGLIVIAVIGSSLSTFIYKHPNMTGYKWKSAIVANLSICFNNLIIMKSAGPLNVEDQLVNVYRVVQFNCFIMLFMLLLIFTIMMHWWQGRKSVVRTYHVYRQFVERFMDTMAIIRGDRFEYINPSGLKMFEIVKKDDLLGKSLYSFIDEKDKERLQQWLQGDCTSHSESIELSWRTTTGKVVNTEITIILCKSAKETYRQVWMKDIMEQKREEELKLQAAKLSAASQIAAGIAHEIRNPLTSVKGFLQLMMSGQIHKKKYYNIMDKELRDIEVLINSMLMLSQPLNHEFIRIDVRDVMQSAIDTLEEMLREKQIAIDLRIAKQQIEVYGIPNQLQQVFVHIIEHGVITMYAGGTITIRIYMDNHGFATIVIQDEGGGISEEQLARMGQPYYITVEEGTGIELMIAYKIIDNHRGRIKVDSVEGFGTTFTLTLPVMEANHAWKPDHA
ncbi:ATP-binding protein [Paenibacillus yanchengensis]|uniref:histidine kinase n=1 Tax=Paenibacillus yanchengensis TaxID=2035833 RepID=A0ABW4YG82_9BACL